MVRVRIPRIVDMKTALRVYYSNEVLCNKDIVELFGRMSGATIVKLKSKAREYMDEHGITSHNANAVNTDAAFAAWGLDIDDIERRYNKLKKLELYPAAKEGAV